MRESRNEAAACMAGQGRAIRREGVLSALCRLAVLLLATASLILGLAATSEAAKIVTGSFCPVGTQGGQCGTSVGRIAINNSGTGVAAGTIYITDSSNNRVQRFSPAGVFQRAWGFDVDDSNPSTGFEVCTVAASCKAGTATATVFNGGQLGGPQGIDIDQATGHVYVIDNSGRRVQEFDADGNFIRAWGSDVTVDGGASDPTSQKTFQICEVAAECKSAATAGTDGGRFGNNPRSLVVDPSHNVWVADTANRRFQKFDATGNFLAVYGFNVNGGGALENCTSTAAGVCKAGTAGTTTGQFTGFSPFAFAFDSAGNLYANDGNNATGRAVVKFPPAMTSASIFANLPNLVNNDAMLSLPGDHLLAPVLEGSERQLVELDSAGSVVETALVGVGLTSLLGIARSQATGTLYATSDTASQAKILKIEDGTNPPPPVLTVNPVTTKTGTTATLSANVDPKGGTVTSCSFQYSTDQENWTNVNEPDCPPLDPNGGSQAISESISGLTPNTTYFARVTMNRLFIGGTSTSSAVEFQTDPVPPVVSLVGSSAVTDTSAILVGTVNPLGTSSEYFFEYGTTLDLESATSPVTVEAGQAPVIAAQVLSGLQPGIEYHFRLVAVNVAGTTKSGLGSFITDSEPTVVSPDARGYEMVSPPDKNGGGALSGANSAAVGASGDTLMFSTTSLFGNPPAPSSGSFASAIYVSRREAGGWRTMTPMPHYCRNDPESPTPAPAPSQSAAFSPNMDQAVIGQPESASCPLSPLVAGAPLPGMNLYLEDLLAPAADYTLLTPELAVPAQSDKPTGVVAGSSDDFRHVVYTSTGRQTGDAAPAAAELIQIYDWSEGHLRLASKSPGGDAFATASVVPEGTSGNTVNALSASGERLFFQNPITDPLSIALESCVAGTCEVYLREGGNTYDVSESECTVSCGEAEADIFRYASEDGSKALFSSAAKLLDQDSSAEGEDLYLYTHSANPESDQNLTLLSLDQEPGDGTHADFLGVVGISDDAETVYFAADGQIVSGGPTASGAKLYRWRRNGGSPTIEYLATIGSGESQNWSNSDRHVTPGGDFLLIQTDQQVDPAADTDSTDDIYRWSAPDGWLCVSCQFPGSPSLGPSVLSDVTGSREVRRIAMSDDGSRVFFSSRDPLTSEDEDDEGLKDVYAWKQGSLSLVTGGSDHDATVRLIGASSDGADVFFYTEENLVGRDTDRAGDIYDARIGGGFPEPEPEGIPCSDCRGPSSVEPASVQPTTVTAEGPGNVTQRRTPRRVVCKGNKVKRKGRCVNKKPKKRKQQRAGNGNRRAGR